jgi:thiamine biosynthesis lipoprotein
MATLFEMQLVGDDIEHLEAVAARIGEEIDRVEHLLSRFDPASEVYRVNRLAAQQSVTISVELCDVLVQCRHWCQQTDGAFDVLHASTTLPTTDRWPALELDIASRRLRFLHPGVTLDFGAYGKGYALDRVSELLAQFGVHHAFVHGGTSSVLACGCAADGESWRVRLARPKSQAVAAEVTLIDEALLTSWGYTSEESAACVASDDEGCVVRHPSAAVAEVLSTAMVVMGEAAARERASTLEVDAGWLSASGELTWWRAEVRKPLAVKVES